MKYYLVGIKGSGIAFWLALFWNIKVDLGVEIAKIDEQYSKEKSRKDLVGAIAGFGIIFVLIVALKIAVPILEVWVKPQI